QFGWGLAMALYCKATRCRGPSIRREAANGVWDSLQAAQVAEWIIGIENEKASGNKHIPQDAWERGLEVKCIKGRTDGILRVRANLVFT
ncbi:uncharacterized protein K444DRAFT_548970, partial [Hyaloscypha bicolor E]